MSAYKPGMRHRDPIPAALFTPRRRCSIIGEYKANKELAAAILGPAPASWRAPAKFDETVLR
jgi:hypothetical protein